jgi:hypothetical protein
MWQDIKTLQTFTITISITKFRRDSVVSTATRYGLDGAGIESRRGRNFPHSSTPAFMAGYGVNLNFTFTKSIDQVQSKCLKQYITKPTMQNGRI